MREAGGNGGQDALLTHDVTPRMRRNAAPHSDTLVAVDESFVDNALDTVATFVRAMGEHAFPMDEDDRERFNHACEQWAKHVLTGAQAPLDPGSHGPPPDRRAWAPLRRFFRRRRAREEKWVRGRLKDFKAVLWEVVDGLRAIAKDGKSAEATIHQSLGQVEAALDTGSIDQVREALSGAVKTINKALEEQRNQLDAEIVTLGTRLAEMRDDLAITQAQARLDPLTQLHNRGAFDESLRRYIDLADLSHQPLTLLMVDIDHFKKVNDERGHPVGDLVITKVAAALVRSFPRKHDFVARYGGEEFAVILFDTDAGDAARLAERLLTRVRNLDLPEVGWRITCSVGVAGIERGEDMSSLIERADQALYRAKRDGRNRVRESGVS